MPDLKKLDLIDSPEKADFFTFKVVFWAIREDEPKRTSEKGLHVMSFE